MAWLTPDSIPEDDDCRPLFIPNNSDWLAIVSGAILELTREWNWEAFGSVTPAQAAERMQTMMQQYYDEGCGGGDCPPVLRIGETGNIEELIDGEWVSPEGALELPPTPARSEGTLLDRRCMAAANAARVLELLYEEISDGYNADLDLNQVAVDFVALFATLVLVPVYGLAAAALIALGKLIWSIIYDTLEFIGSDFWTTDFNDKLLCALFDSAEDGGGGVIHFNYDLFIDKLARGTEITADLYQLRLFGQLYYLLSFIGSQGLDAAGATTSVTTADCGCTVCSVSYSDDMKMGLGSRTQPQPIVSPSVAPARWQPTGGRSSDGCLWGTFSSGNGYYIYVRVDLGQDCYVQTASMWWHKSVASKYCSLRVLVVNQAGTITYNELVHNGTIAGTAYQQYYRIIGLATGRYLYFSLFTEVAGGQLYMDDIIVTTA